MTDGAGPDVAGQDAAEECLGIAPRHAVLEQWGAVEDAGAVADREVLELLGQLVFLGDQVARPVLPQAAHVGGAGPFVERRRADHESSRTVSGSAPGAG